MIWYTLFNEDIHEFLVDEKKVYNVFCFDVEVTSVFIPENGNPHAFTQDYDTEYYSECDKVGFVYIWMLSIDGVVYYGRTLEQYVEFIAMLDDLLDGRNKIFFVHNLSYEFQFLRNIFSENVLVFARKTRRPMYARDYNIEYRCTYFLTRLSLDEWAKSKKLPCQKLVGQLNYNVLRTPYTVMTAQELEYCEHDVVVMDYGLEEYVNRYGTVWNIPLTQTGCVRKDFNKILHNNTRLHKKMSKLMVRDINFFRLELQAMWGGIAHACICWVDQLLTGIDSWDIKSSYPYCIVAYKYPMTPFLKVSPKPIYFNNETYSFIITFEVTELQSKLYHTYISSSKCEKIEGGIYDNGRVEYADYVLITCTNIDYDMIMQSYDYKSINILDFRVSINEYLDNDVCKFVLDLYNGKCTLDGIPEQIELYRKSKEGINACFGMMITRLITDEIIYNGELEKWDVDKLTEEKFDELVTKQLGRPSKLNTCFAHGLWILAYARRNLWRSVIATDGDSVYLDTDSNKLLHGDLYKEWFEQYNADIWDSHYKIADRLGISADMLHPKRPDGKICPLGCYEFEETYKEFKTLGAKKYCYKTQDDVIHITVSGVRKSAASQLKSVDDFKDGFVFDIEHAKKLLLHYNDNQPAVTVNAGQYDQYTVDYRYGICAQPTTYTIGILPEFADLIYDYMSSKSEILYIGDFLNEERKTLQSRRTEKSRRNVQGNNRGKE